MLRVATKLLKRVALLIAVVGATILGVRSFDASRMPPLELWHTYVPKELSVQELDAADWKRYLDAENAIFASVRANVTEKLDRAMQVPSNRYYEAAPIYPGRFANDWNRSYVGEPAGKPVGAVVLLHGLTDTPYSLRNIGRLYNERGFVSIGIRLPAHGTVPAALTRVQWEDWMAATRLAVREARARAGPGTPLHIVGFSNGGALAVKYTLDALEDKSLARPDRIVLVSPMIGITRFARFAGLAGLPALLPPFAKAAWLSVLPEFNPFKYNSFPVNGARQSYRLTDALQEQIARLARDGRLAEIPPVLTFQSILDYTVSTPAILSALYAHLPDNGSEIVVFDVNRTIKFSMLLRASAETAVARIVPPAPRNYRVTVIGTVSPSNPATIARTTDAGQTSEQARELDLPYPAEIFSLSHVAIPFALDDSLYGLRPGPGAEYGANLGTIDARGERGALIVSVDFLARIASNPFFPYVLERIGDGIDKPAPRPAPAAKPSAPLPSPAVEDARSLGHAETVPQPMTDP